jgi:metallophosphoesterase (TIGR03767 family)
VSGSHPRLTVAGRIGPGAALRHGSEAAYRGLSLTDGEPYGLREDLLVDPSWSPTPSRRRRAVLCFAHVTDLQLADVQSPARFEFLNREYADPRFAELVPVQRPHEALTARAVEAMVRVVNEVEEAPLTGTPLELVLTTGDAIDNAQWNELAAFLALLDGGRVQVRSGGRVYEGVQAAHWPDTIFWRPDPAPGRTDVFREAFGFPEHPGLIEAALRSFDSAGLRVPWLACYGNHEALIQGVGVVTPRLADALVGGSKPSRLPPGFDADDPLEVFLNEAEAFLDGHPRAVTPDPERRARPRGHGFTDRNRRDGTAYYAHDVGPVRFVTLDTTCLAGGSDGCLDTDQLGWLVDRLVEVHSSYRGADGSVVRTGNPDRLVVLASHHGLDTLTNTRDAHLGPGGGRLAGAAEIRTLLHRFGNVVLWVNGHTHTNSVTARLDPVDHARGFWEVTTCAVVDWPCQSRLLEIVDEGDGTLSIVCTMVDHDGVLTPHDGWPSMARRWSAVELAGLHRELAANAPFSGHESRQAGTAADRNVVLRMRAPFRAVHARRD